MQSQRRNGFGIYLLLILVIIFLWYFFTEQSAPSMSMDQLMIQIKEENVQSIGIHQNEQVPTGVLNVTLKKGEGDVQNPTATVYVSDVNAAQDELEAVGFKEYVLYDVPQDSWFTEMLPMLIVVAVLFILFMILMNGQMMGGGMGGGNSRMMNFGKSRAKLTTQENMKTRFADVAGLIEEKEELVEVVDFLKDPAKYTKVGARIPKGMILVGPPGTGKTLLARAVAGEAGVPFFSISGSDFVEMFVGVGASRVRDLFEDAKKNAPCIVFIDEIDAVARKRGSGMGGGHDEREQTLNQILVEMDGFGVNEGIIVMAATNRVDILDPAIMRPGRFDRKVFVGRPDVRGREEILNVHAKNKPLSDDVDLKQIAQTTAGFTGADLENLLNEAAIATAKDNRAYLTQKDIKNSFVKVGIGTEKRSKVISEKEKKITAYHEAGHAILFHVLPDVGPVYSVSIIPTGQSAAGYTMPLPEKDEMFNTKSRMMQNIVVDFGGRVAEELIFGDVTTGASQDIKQATNTARHMVTRFGFSDRIGPIDYHMDEDEVFLGRDYGHVKSYSEEVAAAIDEEVSRIIDECYARAKSIISEHMDVLHSCAELLIEKEKISRKEFEALFGDQVFEKSEDVLEREGVAVED
ncbi:MAG: ATP-dependent zinc metalloprotease FtsH [Lachnospiraceae bacterium]|nr:ATP-dependent zinc metalloprotease FtsH [Lachnospiraceae bacterium]